VFISAVFCRAAFRAKTGSHPKNHGRSQEKQNKEHDALRDERQEWKPVLHGTKENDDAQASAQNKLCL
jgi:hypothetical protein